MALRLGIDLDGVLADMEVALARHAGILFRDPVDQEDAAAVDSPDDVPSAPRLHLTMRQQKQLWQQVRAIEGFWETLDEIEPGIVARLAALAAERRWEIIFLTKRPATVGATAQLQSQRWLQARGFPLPSVYVVNGSRGHIAAALGLDMVVDDTPGNCLDVATDSKARVIGIFRNPEQPIPSTLKRLGIHVVRSTGECLDLLSEIDSGVEKRPGAIERVLQVLGLKQSARA